MERCVCYDAVLCDRRLRVRLFRRAGTAAPYYVTVAGLGGEPDYEQRFTALAKDLDKLLKAAGAMRTCTRFTGATRRARA